MQKNEASLLDKKQKNKKKRIVIFGTGKVYDQWKNRIKKDMDIIAFLDNNIEKIGTALDNIPIYHPCEINHLTYDYIFILSIYFTDMKNQLLDMGVSNNVIYDIERLEELCVCEETKVYGDYFESKDSKKNILIFSHALISTGAQNVLFYMLKILRKNNYAVTVISKTDGMLRERLLQMGVTVVVGRNIINEEELFNQWIKWSDYVLVNTMWLYYAVDKLSSNNVKVIWWIHEYGAIHYVGKKVVANIIHRNMVKTYVVSPLLARTIGSDCNRDNLDVLLFGIPEYENISMESDFSLCTKTGKEKKVIFAIIAEMDIIKGQDIFIEAVKNISCECRKRAEFWIIGRGKLPQQYLDIVDNVEEIKILGEIDNRRMKEVYYSIDVVVSCSREDSMSVVAIEGMMNEKLVIVSDAMGIADYITDGQTGFITPCEDVEALTNKIMWVMDNQDEAVKIGKASRKVYDDYFSMEEFEKNVLKVFKD